MYGQKSGLEAAVAAATKLDASLHAKGKLTKNLSEGLSKSDVLKLIQAEFSINHVSQSTRNLLCKGTTQEIIKDFSGACVSTKGRYIPENERKAMNLLDRSSKNLGLYLFIQGPTNRSVDLAIQKIEEMIAASSESNNYRTVRMSLTPPNSGNGHHPASMNAMGRGPGLVGIGNGPPGLMNRGLQLPPSMIEQTTGKFVEKIRIGMDNVLPGFNLPMKLIGQGGSNLNYIKNETGASVILRGMGSAFIEPGTQQEAPEPLHFYITHHKPEVMASARDLALNLIATVQQEYAQFQMQQPHPQNIPAQIQQINVEHPPNLMLHQPGNGEHPIMQQPIPNVMSTSIALPVVQTGFIQQPAVTQLTGPPPPMVGVPPPHFSQPPPGQVALPPPGVHIPQQQGPLVPPPPGSQHLQLQPQHEQPGNFIQQIAQPFQPGQQTGQQYVITQNGQPMQGIMTSQGLVVLNQQTQPTYAQQQVFLSQPPPVGPNQPVFQSGQHLALQSSVPGQQLHAAVSGPVSYQFQYVQQNPPPNMGYPAVQNPIQNQPPQHIQIQPPQQQPIPQPQMGPNPAPNGPSGQSPIHNQPGNQPNPHGPQPPPHIPPNTSSHSPQNHPPNQRHSPNLQGPPPPNQPNPSFPVQPNQNQMLLQHAPNNQMIQGNPPVSTQNQSVQTVPVSSPGFLPGQPLPGQPLPGQPLPGQPLPGQPLPGQPLPGQPLPGQPLPGQPLPGQPLPGQPLPGQPLPGQPLPGQPLPGQPLPGQPLPGQPLPGQPLPGQPLPGQPLPGQPLPGQPLPGQPLPGQPLPGQPLPGQPLPGQPLPGQPLPGQPLPGQPLPGQPQLMHIQGVRPPNEVQPQFQLQQQNYGQYQQQVVMKHIQVCQPQQLQFVPGCPPGPIQLMPANSGQFIPHVQHLPPNQFNQNQEPPQEPKPPKRKFTEDLAHPNPRGPSPPQSLMSLPMQAPQPVPPPSQPVNNNSPRQGVGVQEMMIMSQQQRRQHMQQPEGIQNDPSQIGEETTVVSPPPSSTGNQQNYPIPEGNQPDGDKLLQQRQCFDENQMNQVNRHVEPEMDERNCGFSRRDRNRERPSYTHYSSKPQMYDMTAPPHPIMGVGMCTTSPSPLHMMNQPQGGGPQQPPPNHYFQNHRPY